MLRRGRLRHDYFVEDAQQTGCSDLQPTELDPGPAEAFATASGLSLSSALTLCYIGLTSSEPLSIEGAAAGLRATLIGAR